MAYKINQNDFDKLLNWLGDSVEDGAEEYEHIRRTLIKTFYSRGFTDAEVLTDETIDRVASKVGEIEADYSGKKILYFLGVARFVRQEAVKKKEIQIDKLDFVDSESQTKFFSPDDDEFSTVQKNCLRECFSKLKERHKTLILEYYDNFREEKISRHKMLAEEKSVTIPALRNQVYRVKMRLSGCVKECSEQK
jgi:hypothetical protein